MKNLNKIIDLEEQIKDCQHCLYDLRSCDNINITVCTPYDAVDLRHQRKYAADLKQVMIDYFNDTIKYLERQLDDLNDDFNEEDI